MTDPFKNFQEQNYLDLKTNKTTANRLRKLKKGKVDGLIHDLHDEVFEQIDCLDCANCCKTTSPIFTQKDISKIAKSFRISDNDFIAQYLKLDDEQDYILKESPCHFLDDDNTCSIYDVRPKACRGYPHTDRKNILGIMEKTIQNTLVCPAVFNIFEQLKGI